MAGIGIEEVRTINITTTDGQKIEPGDALVICARGQDIVCRFVEIDKGGYFVTVPFLADTKPVKYRTASISKCYKLTQFEWNDRSKYEEGMVEAAGNADQDTLQPGA